MRKAGTLLFCARLIASGLMGISPIVAASDDASGENISTPPMPDFSEWVDAHCEWSNDAFNETIACTSDDSGMTIHIQMDACVHLAPPDVHPDNCVTGLPPLPPVQDLLAEWGAAMCVWLYEASDGNIQCV